MKKRLKRYLLLLSIGLVVVVSGLYLLGLTFHQEMDRDITIHASGERVWQMVNSLKGGPILHGRVGM